MYEGRAVGDAGYGALARVIGGYVQEVEWGRRRCRRMPQTQSMHINFLANWPTSSAREDFAHLHRRPGRTSLIVGQEIVQACRSTATSGAIVQGPL